MHPRVGAIVVVAVLIMVEIQRETLILLELGRKRRRGLALDEGVDCCRPQI